MKRRISSDSQSIGELLRKPVSYTVPVYQRDFAWTTEEIDVLWDDIVAALSNGESDYFLGAVVLSQTQSKDEKLQEVVDGQQRLASISMLFAIIAQIWSERGDTKRSIGVFKDYLGSEDRRTGEIQPKLSLNETNNPVFQQLISKGDEAFSSSDKKGWLNSNKILGIAFNRLLSRIKKWLADIDDVESSLIDLEEFVADKVQLIVIEVGTELEAFVIFETLNDRGLDLAVSDLVKNYLFSLAGTHIERFKRAWVEISLLVGAGELTTFLRHFWLSEYSMVRERDLYKALRLKVKSTTSARQMMERLRKVADYYAALKNPEHQFWADFSPEIRNYIDALLLFKVTQFRPVALATMEVIEPEKAVKVFRMLMIISFRYTVIAALGTGNLEKAYTNAALAIRQKDAKSVKSIFDFLKSIYVNDEEMISTFSQKHFSKSNVTRYILSQINDYLENDPEHNVAEREGRVTLEHIMPKNPSGDWYKSEVSAEDISNSVDLIGNLTLLEKGVNRNISNMSFDDKKTKAFNASTLALNNFVKDCDAWTISKIIDRTKFLANTSASTWRVDY